MSVSPAQNLLNPPPVPEIPTVTRTPGFAIWNSSAIASEIGNTVLEPSIATIPLRARVVPGLARHPRRSPPLTKRQRPQDGQRSMQAFFTGVHHGSPHS